MPSQALTPPGIRITYHRGSSRICSLQGTEPIEQLEQVHRVEGLARVSEVHVGGPTVDQGPRSFHTPIRACSGLSPRALSLRKRVCPRFHWRQRMHRSRRGNGRRRGLGRDSGLRSIRLSFTLRRRSAALQPCHGGARTLVALVASFRPVIRGRPPNRSSAAGASP